MILWVKSSIPGGVSGDADDTGDVDGEYDGDGVSGVVGGVMYTIEGFGGGIPVWVAMDSADRTTAKGLAVDGGVDFFVDGKI